MWIRLCIELANELADSRKSRRYTTTVPCLPTSFMSLTWRPLLAWSIKCTWLQMAWRALPLLKPHVRSRKLERTERDRRAHGPGNRRFYLEAYRPPPRALTKSVLLTQAAASARSLCVHPLGDEGTNGGNGIAPLKSKFAEEKSYDSSTTVPASWRRPSPSVASTVT